LSQTVPSEDLLGQIVKRDVAKAGRSSTIVYLVNAVIIILGGRIISTIFAPYSSIGFLENLLELLVTGVAVYAIIVHIRTRSRQSKNLGVHLYILGVLGLCMGTLFSSWGAVQYLSGGYWLRQYYSGSSPKAGVNGGEVAVYGTDKLVNLKTSRLVRIGYSIPRKWRYAGIGLLFAGVVWFVLASFLAQIVAYSIGQILVIDGIVLISTWYAEKIYFGGRIRLPEDARESRTD
jgi:uncharacterized membrane protein HdeD (DUF308 family)